MSTEQSPALLGIRVVELAGGVAAALAARLFAAMGADVIRVDRPGGAPGRDAAPFPLFDQGKRSVTIDITRPEGVALLQELIMDTEVLIEDLPPGEIDRLGLGYDALSAIKPRLVHVSITPYGLFGPDTGKTATDAQLLAAAGLTGDNAGPHAAALRTGLHAFAVAVPAAFDAIVMEAGHHVEIASLEVLAATVPEGARATAGTAQTGAFRLPFALDGVPVSEGEPPYPGQHNEQIFIEEFQVPAETLAHLKSEGIV